MKFYSKIAYRQRACVIKFLFVMKLIIVLITTAFLQISFATVAQNVTLSEKNTSLEIIFKKIRVQTGYDFFGDIGLLKSAKKINIEVKNVNLVEALNYCFQNQDITYVISNKIIVFRQKNKSLSDIHTKTTLDLNIRGKIFDENGKPLSGATITIKGTNKTTTTDQNGEYSLQVTPSNIILVSYVGYETREIKVSDIKIGTPFLIRLKLNTAKLKQIDVVSTGYQDLPKERATGSFQTITAKQLEHSTSPDLLRRLEGITTGLDFNNNILQYPTNSAKFRAPTIVALTIRGKNNLNSLPNTDPNVVSGQPLVVIDGIPSPYAIDKINPNDVESINILQDAAAASIWGSRAANGVIVIKTKRGKFQTPTSVFFNANVNVTDKMDLFYRKMMSTSDFIDAQLAQLNYNNLVTPDPVIPDYPDDIAIGQSPLSPVAEIWNTWKNKRINDTQYKTQIDALRNNDIRNDLTKYFLRRAVTQSYNLGVSGGINNYAYYLSAGYDKSINNTINSDADRITVNYSASLKPVKNLSLDAVISYNQQNKNEQGAGTVSLTGDGLYPYSRLVDDNGNPTAVPRAYRQAFIDSLMNKFPNKLLDMSYKPLYDINQGYTKYKNQLMSLNLSASYKINSIFSASAIYSSSWGQDEQNQLKGQNSFYMRDLVNKFTDAFTNPGTLTRIIPVGGFYIPGITKYNNQTLRGQINADKTWADKHELTVILGAEAGQISSNFRNNWLYGYNEQTKTVNNELPFGILHPLLFVDPSVGTGAASIPYGTTFSDFRTRAFSVYSNAAYTYDKRYTVSASFRNDFSSIFGEGTNEHGSPYYSLGGKWTISNEKFYNLAWLPDLQLKATFGYNGNVNATVSPRPLINYSEFSSVGYRLPFASTNNGSNRELRPEKAAMLNFALSFGTKNNRLNGNIEYYTRKTTDLIAETSLDPSTGFQTLAYNAADLRGTGVDISLNSRNLQLNKFSWNSSFLFSYNRVKVTRLFTSKPNTVLQQISNTPPYNEGADLSRLYAFRWAGLDPETGDPMGYIDGKPVRITGDRTVFNQIANAPSSTAHYFGSAVPVYYGSFRNTFNYENFSASFNFLYKLGYYFRRSNINIVRYSSLFLDNTIQGAEYKDRWQKPGDEKLTNVPSVVFPVIPGGNTEIRDYFYSNSEINVLKGDHIRLQEINLSYTFKKTFWAIKNPRIYANVTNLGIVWRANKYGIDPDINDYPNPRTYGFGLSASF